MKNSIRILLAVAATSVFATSAMADTFTGANVHAEFERTVPVVCKIEAAPGEGGGVDNGGWGVHATGKLRFAGEAFESTDAAMFKFTSNVVVEGATKGGKMKLLSKTYQKGDGWAGGVGSNDSGTTPADPVKIYVTQGAEVLPADNATDVAENGEVSIENGIISIWARATQGADAFNAGDLLQADAFFKVGNDTGNDNGPELDCGVNNFKYVAE